MDLDAELIDLLNKSIINEMAFDLIKLGANPNVLNTSGYSLLHLLIFNNRMDDAFRLIEIHHARINIKDNHGLTPLYYMLNDECSLDHLMKMIRLGADPHVFNKSGKAPIHYFIRSNYAYVIELLGKHPESVLLRDSEGTPLEIMLNQRHNRRYTADSYLNLVRCGGDPESRDNQGVSLLNVIIALNQMDRARELIVLSKIPRTERIHYKPEIMDLFTGEGAIEELLENMRSEEYTESKIKILARYPMAKEMVIAAIKKLLPYEQASVLQRCLSPNTQLNQFFSVPRGWFMTSYKRGTLAQLVHMYETILKTLKRDSPRKSEIEMRMICDNEDDESEQEHSELLKKTN